MDQDFFQTLFYGNYRPSETSGCTPEALEIEEQIENLKKHILEKLDNETALAFAQLDDAYTEIIDIYNLDSYKQGIQFASQFFFNSLFFKDNSKK